MCTFLRHLKKPLSHLAFSGWEKVPFAASKFYPFFNIVVATFDYDFGAVDDTVNPLRTAYDARS